MEEIWVPQKKKVFQTDDVQSAFELTLILVPVRSALAPLSFLGGDTGILGLQLLEVSWH